MTVTLAAGEEGYEGTVLNAAQTYMVLVESHCNLDETLHFAMPQKSPTDYYYFK